MSTAISAIITELEADRQRLNNSTGDYEIAHGIEDQMMRKALNWIELNADRPAIEIRRVAELGLAGRDLDFPRYTA